jgi:hypothetical protein
VVAVPALPLVEVTVAFATLSAGFPHPAKRPAAAKITMHRFNCFVFMRGSVYGFFAHIATMSEEYPVRCLNGMPAAKRMRLSSTAFRSMGEVIQTNSQRHPICSFLAFRLCINP